MKKILKPLTVTFLILTVVIAILQFSGLAKKANIDVYVLYAANVLFYVLNIAVLYFQRNALNSNNSGNFIRAVMGSMMFKMFVVVLLVLTYVIFSKNSGSGTYSGKSILIALLMYLVYLFVEVKTVSALNKGK